jgi:flagellar assembly factor FliW
VEKMIIATKYLGEIEVDKEQLIRFENGLPGFLEEKEFVFLPLSEDGLFSILQSVTNSGLAFITTNPFLVYKDYEFDLTKTDQKLLDIKDSKDIFIQVIVTLNKTLEESTVNLQAPLIINGKVGKQVILDTHHVSKHALFNAVLGREESC